MSPAWGREEVRGRGESREIKSKDECEGTRTLIPLKVGVW